MGVFPRPALHRVQQLKARVSLRIGLSWLSSSRPSHPPFADNNLQFPAVIAGSRPAKRNSCSLSCTRKVAGEENQSC